MHARILTLDIETCPSLAYVWSLFKENIPLARLIETGEVICFAAKWRGDDEVLFYSMHHDGKEEMVAAAHRLLSEADIVVTYNGKKFDVPHLNREFVLQGLTPPAPYAQVDLYWTARQKFNFVSNKLDHVVQELGLGAKVAHAGFQLWVDCMAGDEEAWTQMREYNEEDVRITEKLYDRLRPWITSHPTVDLYGAPEDGVPRCPTCGSDSLQRRGQAFTSVSVYQRYQCNGCGKWSRGAKRHNSVDVRGVA